MIDFETELLPNSIAIVKARGHLDESNRMYFFNCISDLMEGPVDQGTPKHIIIECNGLGTLTSAGMATLLAARKRVQKGGAQIYFTHLSSAIAKALELTKLNSLLAIYPTTEELLKKIQ